MNKTKQPKVVAKVLDRPKHASTSDVEISLPRFQESMEQPKSPSLPQSGLGSAEGFPQSSGFPKRIPPPLSARPSPPDPLPTQDSSIREQKFYHKLEAIPNAPGVSAACQTKPRDDKIAARRETMGRRHRMHRQSPIRSLKQEVKSPLELKAPTLPALPTSPLRLYSTAQRRQR